MEKILLNVKNLNLKFGHKYVFQNLSFSLQAGESICVVGPNGVGKTTLLKCLAGLLMPASGTVETFSSVCFLSTIPALLPNRSVLENIEMLCNCYGTIPCLSEVQKALLHVGLEGRMQQNARGLSTGQKRRLTLAATLLIKPSIILADEPSNGLDTQGEILCAEIFKELSQKHKSCLVFASHDPKIIQLAERTLNIAEFIPIASTVKPKLTLQEIFK